MLQQCKVEWHNKTNHFHRIQNGPKLHISKSFKRFNWKNWSLKFHFSRFDQFELYMIKKLTKYEVNNDHSRRFGVAIFLSDDIFVPTVYKSYELNMFKIGKPNTTGQDIKPYDMVPDGVSFRWLSSFLLNFNQKSEFDLIIHLE